MILGLVFLINKCFNEIKRLITFSHQIRTIDRNCEIPHEGPFCDLMWSDPEEIETWAVSPRGAGWLFGSRVTAEVCIQSCYFIILNCIFNSLLINLTFCYTVQLC